MAEANGNYDWRERMKRIEDSIERNWADHERIDRSITTLRATTMQQKENIDELLGGLRDLIDRIPPERLR